MAAGNTYVAIAEQTLGTAAASVTFSSISGAYTDLVIVAQASNDSSAVNLRLQFNGDTATNYSSTRIYADGSTATSDRTTTAVSMPVGIIGASSTDFGVFTLQIQNYSNATTYKTVLSRAGYSTSGYVTATAGLWRSTAAVTSVLLNASTTNFRVGSTFTLYGIAAA
jgi:hypothetical protein